MAIGYANNIIYLYVFGLISLALSSMYVTNKNVERLLLHEIKAQKVYANEPNSYFVEIENPSLSRSFDLEIFLKKDSQTPVKISVVDHGRHQIAVQWTPQGRGWIERPAVILQSRFPFGLLRSWKVLNNHHTLLVYPQRKGSTQFPISGENSRSMETLGLFRELRDFVSTDSPRRIDWKASTKFQKILVKNFENAGEQSLYLTWEQTKHLNSIEERLSQLALWVDLAEKIGQRYALSIPGLNISSSTGKTHLEECLKGLALFEIR